MAGKLRGKLTYANVMATIAVFIALGGASYAALKIPRNSVGTKQLKRHSVGARQLKPLSVSEGKLQENSVGPNSLQGNAVGSDQLAPNSVGTREAKDFSLQADDLDPTAAMPPLFAHVSSSGSLSAQSGVSSAGKISTGQYFVDFNRSLTGCVAVATVGFGFAPGVIGAGATAQARMNLDGSSSKVGVTIYRKGYTFADIEDNDFHLIVAC